MECTLTENTKGCTCTYPGCPHHGRCCTCVANHHQKNEMPGCFFSPEGEALWDRSLSAFRRDQDRR